MPSLLPPVMASEVTYDELRQAIRGVSSGTLNSHGRVAVLSGGVQVDETYYNPKNILLLEGVVNADRLAESRRSGSAMFEVIGAEGFDYVDPLQDFEFVMQLGVELPTKIVWIPLAHLWSVSLEHWTGNGRNRVQTTLVDGATRFREVPWKKTFAITGEPTYGAAIKLIVADRATWPTYVVGDFGATTVPKGLAYSPDSDPWAEIWKLSQSVGGEVYHDPDGVIQLRPVATPTTSAPVLEIGSSEYSIVNEELSRKIDRSEVYNGVICRGSASWLLFPVSGEVWDDDPLSPTYRLGPFGERPKIIEDPVVTSSGQCATMAAAEFNRIAGVRQRISLNAIKDPTLEVGSFIRILQGDLVQGLYVLDTLQMDLVSFSMTASVRKIK